MKRMIVLALLLCCGIAQAQEKNTWSKDLNWMVGHWKGEAFGGTVEEVWSQPTGDTYIGMFWMTKDNKVSFSEYEQITELNGVLSFKVKHFNADLKGWEEKDKYVEFKFISTSADEVVFDGLTLKRIDANTCKHIIKLKDSKTGEIKNVEIVYKRI